MLCGRLSPWSASPPGVCIEYQVTLEDKIPGGETWITGGYNFQGTETTLETTYALQVPKNVEPSMGNR